MNQSQRKASGHLLMLVAMMAVLLRHIATGTAESQPTVGTARIRTSKQKPPCRKILRANSRAFYASSYRESNRWGLQTSHACDCRESLMFTEEVRATHPRIGACHSIPASNWGATGGLPASAAPYPGTTPKRGIHTSHMHHKKGDQTMSTKLCTLALLLALTGLTPAQADTLYVDDDALPGGDGTTWLSAFNDLQLALDAAKVSGGTITEIHVAAGTYRPTAQFEPGLPRTESFQLINNVALKGGYRGCPDADCTANPDERDITQYETILSGDLEGNDIEEDFPDGPTYEDNSLHVIYLPKGLDINQTAILDGCTITAGIADVGTYPDYTHGRGGAIFLVCNSPTLLNCRFVRCHALRYGGAVYSEESSPEMATCVVAENDSISDGAGVYLSSGSPSLVDCTIANNAMWSDYGGYGAGIATTGNCNLTLLRCLISGNQGRGAECCAGGGAFFGTGHQWVEECVFTNNVARCDGGGVFLDAEDVTLKGCIISNNESDHSGGGIHSYADALIENCMISHNTSDMNGGGLHCYYPGPTLLNCLIASNAANEGGAAFLRYCRNAGIAQFLNCTVVGNTGETGGAVEWDHSNPTLTNCILWDNQPAALSDACSDAQITYSNIQGGWPGPGNINADPRFALEADYHLMYGSPCIDAGKNDPCMGFPLEDLEGGPRVLDGNLDGIASIDMGAYECSRGIPILAVSPDVLTCYVAEGEVVSHTEWLQILNAGMDYLNWEIHEDCPWISVSPQSGVSSGTTAPAEINEVLVTFDAGDLTPGQYECVLTITSPDAYNSPRVVKVLMIVGAARRVPSEYPTIQEAIDAAEPHDTVFIADGVYTGPGNRDLDFLGKPITVQSENGTQGCIIDCEQQGRGFYFHNEEAPDSIIRGLTIRNGYVNASSNGGENGGAILCLESGPTIEDCFLLVNRASGHGGAVYADNSDLSMTMCRVEYNNAARGGGGLFVDAGTLMMHQCNLLGNRSAESGGGLQATDGAVCRIVGCLISENNAECGAGIFSGYTSDLFAENTVVANNKAILNTGGIYWSAGTARVTNCTIVGNTAAERGGYFSGGGGAHSLISNSIIYGNSPDQCSFSCEGEETVTYSNIQGGFPGEGNIDVDPMFALNGDFHLLPGSPCIDVGTTQPLDELPLTDLEGTSRSLDGDGDQASTPDMGAYEFDPSRPAIALSEVAFEFVSLSDGLTPEPQTVEIRNSGTGTLNWTLSGDCSWLDATPTSGSSSGESSVVTLNADLADLGVGEYTCTLAVEDAEAINSPKTLVARLYVREPLRVPTDQPTIQAGIDAAPARHGVVLVADGVYRDAGNRDIDFCGKAITLRSENGPSKCIIDCEEMGRGFHLHSGELAGSVLQGFTVESGRVYSDGYGLHGGAGIRIEQAGPTIRNCVVRDCQALGVSANGGGVYCRSGTPTLIDCVIENNVVDAKNASGGGLFVSLGQGGVIQGCIIRDNQVAGLRSGGAGIAFRYTNTPIRDCIIQNNQASNTQSVGGGLRVDGGTQEVTPISNCRFIGNTAASGGGAYARYGCAAFIDCAFLDNTAVNSTASETRGGAAMCDYSIFSFVNCLIAGNRTQSRLAGAAYGGAVWADRELSFVNCVIVNNSADGDGGGLYLEGSYGSYATYTLVNSTVANNTASPSSQMGGGVVCPDGATTSLNNCIVYGNDIHDVYAGGTPDITITYSNIQGGYEGEGNINADPLFLDPDGPDDDPATWEDNDFRLAAGSPCIDAANNLAVSQDEFDLDGDGDRTERIPFDLAGRPRFFDDTATPDTGIADPPTYPEIVDIGAYEFHPADWLPGDLNCDDERTVADIEPFILAVLDPDAYATAFPDCNRARADLNADGAVSGPDIVEFVQELLHPE